MQEDNDRADQRDDQGQWLCELELNGHGDMAGWKWHSHSELSANPVGFTVSTNADCPTGQDLITIWCSFI